MGGLANAPKNEPSKSSTVMTPGGKLEKPKGMLQAISEIQSLSVVESGGDNEIDKNFLSIQQRIDFMNVGMRAGLMEIIWLFILFPIFGWFLPSFLTFFYGDHMGLFNKLIFIIISLMPALLYMPLCIYLGNLYRGGITKLAIDSLLGGRSALMIMLGGAGFTVFFAAYKMMSASLIAHKTIGILQDASKLIKTLPKQRIFYDIYFHEYFKPELFDIAVSFIIVFFFSAIIPVIFVYGKSVKRKLKAKIAKKKLEGC